MTPEGDAPRSARRRLLTWGLPALAIAAATLAVGVSLRSGRDDGGPASSGATSTSRSSTIAWADDEGALWVTSPDDDHVVQIDPATLEVVRQIEVAGQPRELTVLGPDIVVTAAQSSDVTVLRPGVQGDDGVATVPIPCGGSRSVVTAPGPVGNLAFITCPTDDRVVVIDLEAEAAVVALEVPGRPTGIVREGDEVTVSTALDGKLHRWDLPRLIPSLDAAAGPDGGEVPTVGVASASEAVWVDGDRTAASLGALDAGVRGTVGVFQMVDNERKLTRAEIEAGSTYGSPKDGRARLEPAIAGACGARFSSLTDEPRRLSGPVALAASSSLDLVWVVGEFSRSVSVVRCRGAEPAEPAVTVAAFDVGDGARGIVLAEDGLRAFVDVGFDHEVAELDLSTEAGTIAAGDPIERQEPAEVGRRTIEDRYLSPAAQAGRRMFNDATNTHLTPFGVVTCGSCHPSAGEDGLSWRIERVDPDSKEIERKVRRTPPAWEVDPTTKPLHWDGEFTNSDDLALTTIQQLLGGDGLLVDTAPLSAYMREVMAPPERPTASGAATANSPSEGERLIGELGCTTCHAGVTGTDGRAHDVLSPSTVADGDLDAAVTPRLRSVRGRAPYGHDGRAVDLETLLAAHGDGEGGTIDLTPDELAAVAAYLDTR